MNPDRLLAEFDRLVEAPDAVERLRSFIRELAVRGKLFDPDADPRRQATSRDANQVAAVFPSPWPWVVTRDVAECRLGKMLDKAKNRGTPRRYLRNVNVRWFDFDLTDVKQMPFEDVELDEFALRAGDVLICEGGEPGRAAVWDEREDRIYFQKALHRVRLSPSVDPHFFVLTLRACADNGALAKIFTGATFHHLTGTALAKYRFPLPPLAEQQRIVAKVDELMGVCDELEAAQAERERRRDQLTASTIHSLEARHEDRAEVPRKSLRGFLTNLPTMAVRPDQIPPLRQSILHQAVRGNLVPQEQRDEPARLLLGNREKSLSPTEAPWTLPTGWAWTTYGDLGQQIGGGTPSKANESFWIGTIPWVSPKDMKTDYIFDAADHISEAAVAATSVRFIPSGALLMVVRGMILAHSFPTALTTRPVTVNQDMKAIVPFEPEIAPFLLLASKALRSQVLRLVERSTHGTCRLPSEALFVLPIPIPPLAEQRRIVAKVDELMTICDELERSLKAVQIGRAGLLDAVLHATLAEGIEGKQPVLIGAH